MQKLISQMIVSADMNEVRNAIASLIRDGYIYTDVLGGPARPLGMKREIQLEHETRTVWCVGQSAIIAEPMPKGQTILKRLAVKGIAYADMTAFLCWEEIKQSFGRMLLLVSDQDALFLPLAWELRRTERQMIAGNLPALPSRGEFEERFFAELKDDGINWMEELDNLPNMDEEDRLPFDCLWQRYRSRTRKWRKESLAVFSRNKQPLDDLWGLLLELSQFAWRLQFQEIQRLKDCSVEEATARYFAELGSGESVQSQMPAAPKRQGGRPRLDVNEWAYEQVWVKGRERQEVFREWLERIGSKKALLADPRDSFNKAVREKSRKKRK